MHLFHRNFSMFEFVSTPLSGKALTRKRAWGKAVSSRALAVYAFAPALLCGVAGSGLAQQEVAALHAGSSELPDAPRAQVSLQNAGEQTIPAEGSASISGSVLDASGAAIAGARIGLTTKDGSGRRTLESGESGAFTFAKLPPGAYLVTVDAKGFGLFTSPEIPVATKQDLEMTPISLTVGAATTEVTVRPTEVIAAEQIKEEEQQRFLAVIPNYYISYTYNAAPLTTKQKYSLAAHDEFDWTTFVGAGIASGIEQANNSYAGYGQGAAGYGKRYAAAFGDGLFVNFFSHAVYPSIFHQDPRYFYQGSGTNKSRALHAASFAIFTRGDHGQRVPNYSYVLATMTAGALANLYYPHADRGANLVFTRAAIGIAGRAGGTILREFISKPLTTNVHGNGKP